MNTLPDLNDEQIESMRLTIMANVMRSSQQKTRRYRKVVLAAACVVAIGGIGTTVVGAYDGQGSMSSSSSADSSGSAKSVPGPEAQASGSRPLTTLDTGREIITTGSISMRVARPTDSAQKISTYVEGLGGRIDSRDENAASKDSGGSVHLVVRIPQTKVTAALDTLRGYGTVESVNLADQDVTLQGQDLDARIKALGVSVDRLEDIIRNAKSTAAVISAENALTKRQADLDSLKAQRSNLTDQVAMSSIQIDLSARSTAQDVSPSGFRGGFIDGWNGLVATINGAVRVLGVLLPWLAALLLLGGVWAVGRRVARR